MQEMLEKEMATHSSVLAWRIPGTREPGGLPSMGSHRVGHDWSDLAAAAAACRRCKRHGFDSWVGKIPWRREWQPSPVFLPGEIHGQRNLVDYSPWGCKSPTGFSDYTTTTTTVFCWCCLASRGSPRSTTGLESNLRRQWHPTAVLLPGKSHGLRSLAGCSPWGH